MGLATQRDRVTEYSAKAGYELIRIEAESASGAVRQGEESSDEHRPVLQQLVEAAALGEYDVLVVAKLDRLSRDYASLVLLERRLQRLGVTVASVAEENGDGPVAEFIRGQLALVAQLERSMILDRVGAGKAKKKQLGRHVHGRIPYGYVSDRGVLSIDDSTSGIVRRIFADVQSGDSPGRVARALNRDGIPSPQGATWSTKTVALIVANATYAGERYGVKRAHPAIVSRRVLNAANANLEARRTEWAMKRSPRSEARQ